MPDPKTKESAKKPKVKSSGFVLKKAASIIREKYQQQKERNAPEQKDPVRYATDKIENGGKRTLRAADADWPYNPKKSQSGTAAAAQGKTRAKYRQQPGQQSVSIAAGHPPVASRAFTWTNFR